MDFKLRSLYVEHCGPLKDVLIDFCDADGTPRPIIVLAGANGSGKTTAVELIFELLSVLRRPNEVDADSILHRTIGAQLETELDGERKAVGCNLTTESGRADIPGFYFRLINDREALWLPSMQDSLHWQSFLNSVQNANSNQLLSIIKEREIDCAPSVLYFSHLRYLKRQRGEQVQREEIRYQWAYRFEVAEHYNGSLDSYLIWLDYAEPEEFNAVVEFLNGLDFEGKTFGIERKNLRAVVKTKDGDTHGVSELSSGEQNLLIMLLEMRRRLTPHSIVLIDEIENSLHPEYQYRLAKALMKMQRETPFQLFVTTHAKAFPEMFGWDSTLILTEY